MYHAVGHDYRVSAGSFFQTNRFLIDELVQTAIAGTNRPQRARALCRGRAVYPGAGPEFRSGHRGRNLAARLCRSAKKRSPQCKDRACHYRALPGRARGEAGAGPGVLDPPRAGLGEKAARLLGRMSASRVTYVSCDPATLSRDLRVLLESGFKVEQTHLVDLFPQTYHMETVLHLAR